MNYKKEIKDFYDLEVWQKAHQFALDIYKISKNFPLEERFGLINQLRRAVTSITANIAEGFERYHYKDKIRFYYQARGSVAEVQNFLLLARDLNFINSITYKNLNETGNRVRQLINGLIRSINKQQ